MNLKTHRMNVFLLIILYYFTVICALEDFVTKTSYGYVRGRSAKTINLNQSYLAFQGIPFAAPPVGNLRFKSPVPPQKWDGILNATQDRNMCVQGIPLEGSEDCLYINVYIPMNNETKIPVMVWIYGGYFVFGDSTIGNYGPDYLLEQNVIVVTFNYRVGIFGFLSTEDGASPGNYGLKDQIFALKWVKENIESFRGDVNRITLFGQSAGAVSVSYLMQTPLANGLFTNAILQSGSCLSAWALSRNPKRTAFVVGKFVGILTTNSYNLVEHLRNVDYKILHMVSTSTDVVGTLIADPLNGNIFGPSLEPVDNNSVILGKSHEMMEKGQFNKVPCIIGFNSQESKPFIKLLNYIIFYLLTYDMFPSKLIPVGMNMNKHLITQEDIALKIRLKYFGITPVTLSTEKTTHFVSIDQFVRPINEMVRLQSKFKKIYFYRFAYEGVIGDPNRKASGVGHEEEVNYFFRRNQNVGQPSEADSLTRARLVKLWTNFAKTSNPTPYLDDLLQNVVWPIVTSQDNIVYLNIDKNITIQKNPEEDSITFWDSLYKIFGNPPYDTY